MLGGPIVSGRWGAGSRWSEPRPAARCLMVRLCTREQVLAVRTPNRPNRVSGNMAIP